MESISFERLQEIRQQRMLTGEDLNAFTKGQFECQPGLLGGSYFSVIGSNYTEKVFVDSGVVEVIKHFRRGYSETLLDSNRQLISKRFVNNMGIEVSESDLQ